MAFKAFHETLTQSLSSQHSISADNAGFVCALRKRADRKGEGERNCPHTVEKAQIMVREGSAERRKGRGRMWFLYRSS